MSRHTDTIAALATAAGTAAIAVLRVSGPDTMALLQSLDPSPARPRHARHRDYRAHGSAEIIDDVLLTFFPGPRSYTGEDSLEISCHGNPFIAQKILEDLLLRGCRAAEPGEFTQRAFLSGRMDLSQAEAVMDLIHARSERALQAANRQLRGALGRRMNGLIEELLVVLASIEAYIDFPDEDLPAEDINGISAGIRRLLLSTNGLIATSHYGTVLRDGLKTVIVGSPNAGKSSLLNQLVGSDRALVSAEPGTTRDYIEERITVGSHAIWLVDTAGLNTSPAPLERQGMVKTIERIQDADLVLHVVDASDPCPLEVDGFAFNVPPDASVLKVFNKSDLLKAEPPQPSSPADHVVVSALTGEGIPELRLRIAEVADRFAADPLDGIAISARHARALEEARTLLQQALQNIESDAPTELVASDLRGVLAAFGQITGRIDNERMLDELFASFCIGK